MPKFIYHPGKEFDGTDMPRAIDAFGIEFLKGQPTKVEASMFRDGAKYQHALGKLRMNRYFEEVSVEDAKFEEVQPEKRGRKAKPAELPPPADEPASE
jgi:hypothetical protein